MGGVRAPFYIFYVKNGALTPLTAKATRALELLRCVRKLRDAEQVLSSSKRDNAEVAKQAKSTNA